MAQLWTMIASDLRQRVRASWARPLVLERGAALTEPLTEKVT